MGHRQHITLSTCHGDAQTKTHALNHHHLPPVEWSVVDTGSYMTMAHTMLASPSYVLRPIPWGEPPPWQNLELVVMFI